MPKVLGNEGLDTLNSVPLLYSDKEQAITRPPDVRWRQKWVRCIGFFKVPLAGMVLRPEALKKMTEKERERRGAGGEKGPFPNWMGHSPTGWAIPQPQDGPFPNRS